MNYYCSYMDRQEVSAGLHERLLDLDAPRRASRPRRMTYAALAACAALVLGVGVWKVLPGVVPEQGGEPFVAPAASSPAQADGTLGAADPPPEFVVNSPEGDSAEFFYFMPAITFWDKTGAPEPAGSRAFEPGTFSVDLSPEDIQKIFWGPGGVPEAYREGAERQDLPWALCWDGYTLRGTAWYDGQGQLTELTIWGEKERAGFTLELRRGGLPYSCAVELNREETASEYNGVEITGWSKVYDRDGDGRTDYICGSEFLTGEQLGVRFVSRNNGDGLEGESRFNTLFVRQALTGGLDLQHLAAAEHVPAWRMESFETLEQARREAEFAPYLPTAEPEGFSTYPGNKDFSARLRYQEGNENLLFVRWSREYDTIEVGVYRDGCRPFTLADAGNPASYDVRLYEIPWCDTVPEEYWETVSSPAFRAEEMSLAVVEARGWESDTGSLRFEFEVLHPDGTLVTYRCDGMTAQEVWGMVEETLR